MSTTEETSNTPEQLQFQQIEEAEIQKKGYKAGKKLGEGSYANVIAAIRVSDNKHVAIKIVKLEKAPDDFVEKFFPREIEILGRLDHPNVIRMYEKFDISITLPKGKPENSTYLVMELAGHGDLLDFIKLRNKLTEGRSKYFFRQLIEAMDYVHKLGVIHRDMKCENILLDVCNNIKITDFGFARYMKPTDESNTYCGSAAYAAPEVLKGEPYSGFSYDIWSIGIILYIMVCGKMPFDDTDLELLYKLISFNTNTRLQCEKAISYPSDTPEDIVSSSVKALIGTLLEPDVKKRASIAEIRSHEWLSGVPYVVAKTIDEFNAMVKALEVSVKPPTVQPPSTTSPTQTTTTATATPTVPTVTVTSPTSPPTAAPPVPKIVLPPKEKSKIVELPKKVVPVENQTATEKTALPLMPPKAPVPGKSALSDIPHSKFPSKRMKKKTKTPSTANSEKKPKLGIAAGMRQLFTFRKSERDKSPAAKNKMKAAAAAKLEKKAQNQTKVKSKNATDEKDSKNNLAHQQTPSK